MLGIGATAQGDFRCLINSCLRSWEVNDVRKLMAFYRDDHELMATKIFEYVTEIFDTVRWMVVAGRHISSRTINPQYDVGFVAHYRDAFVLALKGTYVVDRNL